MTKAKKQRGRPPMREPIDATPEELAEGFLRASPDYQWGYLKDNKKGTPK